MRRVQGDAASAALERIEEQRAGLTQRQADLEPVLEAAREAVACRGAFSCDTPGPDGARARRRCARVTRRHRCFSGRRQACRSGDKGARDGSRSRAPQCCLTRPGRWRKRQADAEKRLAGARRAQNNFSSPSAPNWRRNRPSWTGRSPRSSARTDESQVTSAKRRQPSARPKRLWLLRCSNREGERAVCGRPRTSRGSGGAG